MTIMRLLHDLTRSAKSKMATAKPEVSISHLAEKIKKETIFESLQLYEGPTTLRE